MGYVSICFERRSGKSPFATLTTTHLILNHSFINLRSEGGYLLRSESQELRYLSCASRTNPVCLRFAGYPLPTGDSMTEKKTGIHWWDDCPSYVLAHKDTKLLERDELRPVRLQLELLKPEMVLSEHNITSTIVVFGGTRIVEKKKAQKRIDAIEKKLKKNPKSELLKRRLATAKNVLSKSHYYDEARKFARIVSKKSQRPIKREYVIVTGGGPGIMEAANRGAHESRAVSIGLNITLPMEQNPNKYITRDLCFRFRYFAIRKMHFLLRAKALIAFPGGYGTLDELFEALTLIQTHKVKPAPIILFGKEYWKKLVDFDFMVAEGTIDPEDVDLFRYTDSAEEAWQIILDFYDKEDAANNTAEGL